MLMHSHVMTETSPCQQRFRLVLQHAPAIFSFDSGRGDAIGSR